MSGRDSRQASDAELSERGGFIDSPMTSRHSDQSNRLCKFPIQGLRRGRLNR